MSWEKKTRCLWLLDKLKRENTLTLEEYECLTSVKALELVYYAAEHAGEARKKVYGNEVYIRGLIKISNRCGNDCFYCGKRRSNKNCKRSHKRTDTCLLCEGLYTRSTLLCATRGWENGYGRYNL